MGEYCKVNGRQLFKNNCKNYYTKYIFKFNRSIQLLFYKCNGNSKCCDFYSYCKTMVITAKIKELQYFEKFSEIFVLPIFILLTNLLAKLIFKIISNIINKKGRKNEKNNLSISTSIKDLQNPIYKGMLSITDIKSSSTAWLLLQALISEYGEDQAKSILKDIYANAGEHIESSGSAPIKKVRAGEVALGFGLRQKAVSDKKEGLPIDYVDPKEGNFVLTESLAVVDKGKDKNDISMKMAECIIKEGRKEIIKSYPIALYQGESTPTEDISGNIKYYKEKLTVDLLKEHQKLSEECK